MTTFKLTDSELTKLRLQFFAIFFGPVILAAVIWYIYEPGNPGILYFSGATLLCVGAMTFHLISRYASTITIVEGTIVFNDVLKCRVDIDTITYMYQTCKDGLFVRTNRWFYILPTGLWQHQMRIAFLVELKKHNPKLKIDEGLEEDIAKYMRGELVSDAMTPYEEEGLKMMGYVWLSLGLVALTLVAVAWLLA